MTQWPKKPVFPVIYFILFVWSIFGLVYGFLNQPPPKITEGFYGDQNRAFVIVLTNSMIGILGLYLILNYLAFEGFEHGEIIESKRPSVGLVSKLVELLLRIIVAAIVGLKIINWVFFEDVFAFILSLSIVLALWHLYCAKFHGIKGANVKIGVLNFIVALLAVAASALIQTENGEVTYAAALICIVMITFCVLSISSWYLIFAVKEHTSESALQYLINWD